MHNKLLQIIDANLNRTREGLRVCEDIARFAINDKDMARSLKLIRHGATRALINSNKIPMETLLKSRDTEKDSAKFMDFKTRPAVHLPDLFMSNMERAKESLRVLEECSKIIDGKISQKYRKLRFNSYDVEKRAAEKIRRMPCDRRHCFK